MKNFYYLDLGAAFGAGCLLTGIVTHFRLVRVDLSVSLDTFITAIATIATAVIVGWYIQRYVNQDQSERRLFLDRLSTLLVQVEKLDCYSDGGDLPAIISQLKTIRFASHDVRDAAVDLQLSDAVRRAVDFTDIVTELRTILTQQDGNKIDSVAAALLHAQVKSNKISWSEYRSSAVVEKLRAVRRQIFNAQAMVIRQ